MRIALFSRSGLENRKKYWNKNLGLVAIFLTLFKKITFSWQFQDLLEHRHARTRIQQCCLRAYSSYSILPFSHDFLRGKFYHMG